VPEARAPDFYVLKKEFSNMAKSKEDIRPLSHIAPPEHKDREGMSEHSGFQPSEKFSNQGSLPYSNDEARRAPTRTGLQKK
jgi:hypothetical protein